MNHLYDFLLGLILTCIGIYFLYTTYKKPAPFYSTDVKGYLAGMLFVVLGLLSLMGKYRILGILKKWIE